MDTPQFQKAEYGSAKQEACTICKQPVGATYYRVNGALACENCATQAKNQTPESTHAHFMRGLLFGIGGAVLGLIIYATFSIVTGIEIGFVSLAVGYIVGKSIKMGSRGFGGSHYQILAAVLTYAAVSMSAVPIGLAYVAKQHPAHSAPARSAASPGATATDPASQVAGNSADDGASAPPSNGSSSAKPAKGLGTALLYLAFLGLASPFMEIGQNPVNGAIGIIILLVGIRIAWRLTAMSDHAQVVGPFKNSTASAPAAPPASLG